MSAQLTRSQAAALLPEWQLAKQPPLLAATLSELETLNAAADPAGPLVRVGLRLVPDEFDDGVLPGIRVSELPALAPALRRLDRLTVRGCWVRGNLEGAQGKELARFLRCCYESAKRMSAALPCAMPYLCAEGVLGALGNCADDEDREAALAAGRIVAAQNATAFYARLYVT
jgi:hypothetical protein